jgi:nitroreductase
MDTFETIIKRKSIRSYSEKPVPAESVKKILEVARLAPSGSNRQPWRFVVVQDAKRIKLIKMFSEGLSGNPTLVIAICAEAAEPDTYLDIGIATENIMLEAVELGLGSCAIGSFSEEPVKQLLGIPKEIPLILLISIGYPEGEPRLRPRKALEEIAYGEKYGERLAL